MSKLIAAFVVAIMSTTAVSKPCTDEDAGFTALDNAAPTGFLWETRDDRGCHVWCEHD